jgi:hypothetical protein
MKAKHKQQAMPASRTKPGSRRTRTNPDFAGPNAALAERPAGKPPRSGPPGAEGNNTRRDFVKLPRKPRK